MILDTHAEVFVWVGQSVDRNTLRWLYVWMVCLHMYHYIKLLKEMNHHSLQHTSCGIP
ncbi:hypothetical protein OIU74_029866 [Salix koriyanagi]|uniref:Gelsolin-like domain-containing protein n=1 Tax=Salix koriyanagi TaxID=2511006 RepID=A0A9Q0VH85_9ROSI|nr:hypothetical protein OIU74_029866 [Salix koriyanagi]